MPSEDIEIEYDVVAGGTLRIDIRTIEGMEIFRRALREMAGGPATSIGFSEQEGVEALQGLRLFLGLGIQDSKMTMNHIIHGWDVKRDWAGTFIWKRSRQGWESCVELAEGMAPGSRQRFFGGRGSCGA